MNLHKPCLSDSVRKELQRLKDSKNPKLNQRFDAINGGVMRALLNPKNVENIPSGLKPYRAEKIGGQIRLFYEMIEGSNVVHFVWVNDENCLHDTNNGQENDPCYNEFTRLYNNGLLPKYAPEVESKEVYQQRGKWLSQEVYASLKDGAGFAECNMCLVETSEREYEIRHLYSTSTTEPLETRLLARVIDSSKLFGISFLYDLLNTTSSEAQEPVRNALIECGFKLTDDTDGMEVWAYRFQKK